MGLALGPPLRFYCLQENLNTLFQHNKLRFRLLKYKLKSLNFYKIILEIFRRTYILLNLRGCMKSSSFILLLCFLSACSGISPQQKLGADKLSAGSFFEAQASLEAAKAAGDTNDELYIQLSDARFKNAQDQLSKAKEFNKNDLPGVISLLESAKLNATGALDELNSIPKVEEGLKNITAKKELLEQISKELELRTEEKNKVVSKAQSLKVIPKNKTENAYLDCHTLSPFKEYIPEVKEAYDFISAQLIKELSEKGWASFDKEKLSDARSSFDKILKYFPGDLTGTDGSLCVKISENTKKQDYKTAFGIMQEIKKGNASAVCVGKLEKNLIERLIKSEFSLAQKKEKEKKINSVFEAIDHYNFLINLSELNEEQRKNTAQKLTEARGLAAALLINKAKSLSTAKENSPLVWTLLKWAYRFDPVATEKMKPVLEEAWKYLEGKKEFRTLLILKKNEGELYSQLEQQIRAQVVTASPTPANTEFVTVFGNEALGEEYINGLKQLQDISRAPASIKKQVSTYDYVLWLNLLDYKAEEYGANQPYYKSSRYVSGTRMLDNPDWFVAQQQFQKAQADYNQSYQYNQQMMSQCNNMSNPFAAGLCKGAWGSLSTAGVDNARAKLNATPRYIQENIISDYTYRQYKVGVNLYLRVEERMLDNKENTLVPLKTLEYKVTRKEGEILEGVQPSDVNGIKEGRFSVPDLQAEKRAGNEKISSDVYNDLKEIALKEKGMRYCHTKGLKKENEAMASYQLCLLFTQNPEQFKDKPEYAQLQLAQKKLTQFYQVSALEIQKYALSEAELPKSDTNPFLQEIK